MWRQQYQLLRKVVLEGPWVPFKQVVVISEDKGPSLGISEGGCPVC